MSTTPTSVTGFATGALVTLRPVLEQDLPRLAQLLAANPSEPDRQPWTLQRLKHKFEDKDAPGLWDSKNRKRTYAVLRNAGGDLIGYVQEREDWHGKIYWCQFQLDERLPELDTLALDLLTAYREYMQAWYEPLRLSFSILGCEEAKARQLCAAGYELELTRERMVLWLGRPQSLCTYTWFSTQLLAELAQRDAAGQGGV